jgi:hypothetical protein
MCSLIGKGNISVTFLAQRDVDISLIDNERKNV